MPKDTETTKFLRKCEKGISDPDLWVRGCEMKRRKGKEMYCLLGIAKATAGAQPGHVGGGSYDLDGITDENFTVYHRALGFIRDAIAELFPEAVTPMTGKVSIPNFNDRNHRPKKVRHRDVMSVMKKAIALSRGREDPVHTNG